MLSGQFIKSGGSRFHNQDFVIWMEDRHIFFDDDIQGFNTFEIINFIRIGECIKFSHRPLGIQMKMKLNNVSWADITATSTSSQLVLRALLSKFAAKKSSWSCVR